MTKPTTISKHAVLAVMEQLPDEIDVEELMYRLQLQQKLAGAEADIAAGRTISQDEIDRKSTRLNSSHIQKSRMPSSA